MANKGIKDVVVESITPHTETISKLDDHNLKPSDLLDKANSEISLVVVEFNFRKSDLRNFDAI